MPGLNSYTQVRDVMLSFDDDVGHALREACLDDAHDEAICLAKAADVIRRDMFGMQTVFDGSFPCGCHALSMCLFTTRLNCREPIGSRPCSVHCPDYPTHTLTTRSRPSESLNAATWCLLSVMYMHRDHGAICCLDTHQ